MARPFGCGRPTTSRERLLALLWPDATEEASRNVLNHALNTLRRDLGDLEGAPASYGGPFLDWVSPPRQPRAAPRSATNRSRRRVGGDVSPHWIR
jgi:hypothetical protein